MSLASGAALQAPQGFICRGYGLSFYCGRPSEHPGVKLSGIWAVVCVWGATHPGGPAVGEMGCVGLHLVFYLLFSFVVFICCFYLLPFIACLHLWSLSAVIVCVGERRGEGEVHHLLQF